MVLVHDNSTDAEILAYLKILYIIFQLHSEDNESQTT